MVLKIAIRPKSVDVVAVGITVATPKPRLSAKTLEIELTLAAPPNTDAKSTAVLAVSEPLEATV